MGLLCALIAMVAGLMNAPGMALGKWYSWVAFAFCELMALGELVFWLWAGLLQGIWF